MQMELNKELLLEKAKVALKEAEKLGATQAEITINYTTSALTRIANSIIDQNVAELHATVSSLVYIGKRKGSTSVEVFDEESIADAVANAVKIAKISPENKDFKSLPTAQKYPNTISLDELISKKTMNATPEQRAEYSMTAINAAHAIDKRINAVAGAISNNLREFAIVNSNGVECYSAFTSSTVNLTVLAEDGKEQAAGWSADSRKDFTQLKIEDVAKKAAKKSADGFGMKYLEPGNYEVILEPAAVGGFMFFMSYFGFSAMMYQDYVSFLRDRIGEKMFSEKA